MANERRCENCTKECPKAKVIREIAEGRMWATKEFINLQRKIDNGTLVEVVRCRDCRFAHRVDGPFEKYACVKANYFTPWFNGDGFCSCGERRCE